MDTMPELQNSPEYLKLQERWEVQYQSILGSLALAEFERQAKLYQLKMLLGARVFEKCLRLETATVYSVDYWAQYSEPELDRFLEIYVLQ